MKERQEQHTQRVNRACLYGVASKWQGAPPRSGSARMAAVATSSARAAAICFSAAKCSLRSWLLRAPWLRAALIWWRVGDLGGRCRARAGGQGMWDVEGGGGCGSGVDYLPG